MGSEKAKLVLGGRTFLGRVVAAAGEAFDEVVAVQREGGSGVEGSRTIHERDHEGTAAIFGLERAMEDAGAERFWLLGVDYPLITGALLRDLRRRWGEQDAEAFAPVWNERPQMLCAGWSGTLRGVVCADIDAGRYRLRDVFSGAGGMTVAEQELRDAHPGEPLLNVNEPADLERARRIDEEAQPSG